MAYSFEPAVALTGNFSELLLPLLSPLPLKLTALNDSLGNEDSYENFSAEFTENFSSLPNQSNFSSIGYSLAAAFSHSLDALDTLPAASERSNVAGDVAASVAGAAAVSVGATGSFDSIAFSTSETPPPVSDSYALQPWQRLAWLLVFGGMVLVAAAGNLIVIWIVLVNRQMRTVTNAFIVNLSIADIMVSTLNVVFNFIYMLNGDWVFGSTYCKVSNFIAILSVAASVRIFCFYNYDQRLLNYLKKKFLNFNFQVFTLMAISIDR